RWSGATPTVYSRSSTRTLTASVVELMRARSRVLLPRLEPRDHRRDPRARLIVLRQALRAIPSGLPLLLSQRPGLLGVLLRTRAQAVDARGQGAELGKHVGAVHAGTIGRRRGAVKARPPAAAGCPPGPGASCG